MVIVFQNHGNQRLYDTFWMHCGYGHSSDKHIVRFGASKGDMKNWRMNVTLTPNTSGQTL